MNKYLLYFFRSRIEELIKDGQSGQSELLLLLEDWCQYNNPNMEEAVNFILEYSDDLTDEFFDRFIEILDKYGKTEYALKCVRKIIEDRKKERFEL